MQRNFKLFPPLRGVVKWLMIANVLVFVLQSLLIAFFPGFESGSVRLLALSRAAIFKGWAWQLLTYAFMHGDTSHILFNMLSLWIFGPAVEDALGRKRFLGFYLSAAAFGAIITVLASSGLFMMFPGQKSLGASGAIMGVMVAFGVLYANSEIYLIPFPVAFKAKYLVALFVGLDILGLLRAEGAIAYFAHLGGAIFAFFYIRFFFDRRPAPALYAGRGLSDRAYAGPSKAAKSEGPFARMKNAYYRWKRKRAARKFEVYMRDHDRDVKFDEHGNYIPPTEDPPKKGNGEDRGGWVN